MSRSTPTYLVAINDKPHSIITLELACQRAQKMGAKVSVITVIDPLEYNVIYPVAEKMKEELRTESDAFLSRLQLDMQKKYDITIEAVIREGNIVDEIIAHIAETADIALLILGVASDGSTNRTNFIGNLTAKIGVDYQVPLMVVPGNVPEHLRIP